MGSFEVMDVEKEVIKLAYDNKNLYNVVLELTTKCNWKCRHCYISEHSDNGMPKEKRWVSLN